MDHKPLVFINFKTCNVILENKMDLRVKYLRSVNGDEYCSKEFIGYCLSVGQRGLSQS